MSYFTQKLLLQIRSPITQFQRHRGKINIQRPRAPHYERARVLAVTQPIFPEPPKNKNCFKKFAELYPESAKPQVENPYNAIIAREVLNWLNHSKMIGIFHVNSILADDMFKVRVALHKQNMHLKSYGKKIIQMAVENTKYEAIVPLFEAQHCIVFSTEENISKLISITKKVPQMILIAGVAADKLMSRNEFIEYGQLPDLQVMRSQFVSALNMAASQLVNNLESHQKLLTNMLDVYAKSDESKVNSVAAQQTPIESNEEKPK